MDIQELNERIEKYFKNEDIQTNEEIISAYNLMSILKIEFMEARKAIKGDYYQGLINQNHNSKLTKLALSIKNKNNKESKENYLNYKCIGIVARTNEERAEAHLCFEGNRSLNLYRDFNSYDIYHEENIDYKFIHTNFDILNEYFNALEEFTKKTNMMINNFKYVEGIGYTDFISQTFSDGFLVLTLRYDNRAHVEINISVNSDTNLYEKSHYGRGSIASIVEARKNELLKKIPIKIDELDMTIQNIVKSYLNNEKIRKLD